MSRAMPDSLCFSALTATCILAPLTPIIEQYLAAEDGQEAKKGVSRRWSVGVLIDGRFLVRALVYWPVAVLCVTCLIFGEPTDVAVWFINSYCRNLTWVVSCVWLPYELALMLHDTPQGHNQRDGARVLSKSRVTYGFCLVLCAVIAHVVVTKTSRGAMKYI